VEIFLQSNHPSFIGTESIVLYQDRISSFHQELTHLYWVRSLLRQHFSRVSNMT